MRERMESGGDSDVDLGAGAEMDTERGSRGTQVLHRRRLWMGTRTRALTWGRCGAEGVRGEDDRGSILGWRAAHPDRGVGATRGGGRGQEIWSWGATWS